MNAHEEIWNMLELPSDLTAEDPDSLKQWLLAALVAQRACALSGQNVTRIGTPAIQLLIAFRRECEAQGLRCELRDASPALRDALVCVGLEAHLASESSH
jgi:anti-anti-sigma regulatory factor